MVRLRSSFIPAKVLTPQRKAAIGDLYALLGGNMKAIKEYFQRCADTPFLCGRNRAGWRANLDYGLRELAERMRLTGRDGAICGDVQSRRILSRICGMCYIVELGGGDYRMQGG